MTETSPLSVAVVGGGPAGSFFAIRMIREARRRGRPVQVTIFERRAELHGGPPGVQPGSGCAYCAGGISPRMSDVLRDLDLHVPPEIVMNRVQTITVQSHWKNLELQVPAGREMYCVYRGSRPRSRANRFENFDAFLLAAAEREGARVVRTEVRRMARGADRRPFVEYVDPDRLVGASLDADFLVFAGGVNQFPGRSLETYPLVPNLVRLIPDFVPPQVRRTAIFELELSPELAAGMEHELFFVLYGSRHYRIEMGSIMPKGRFLTVALIGPAIDRLKEPGECAAAIRAFLDLPHIRRMIPRRQSRPAASCVCFPSMVVAGARFPYGERVACVGDMATSRLYKDGIYSAYVTSSGLVDAILDRGVDRESLRRGYAPVVRRIDRDQRYGRLVFLLVSLAFRDPVISRMTYQAILRERRTAVPSNRRLESILWRISSGDDDYRAIFSELFRLDTIWRVFLRGVLVTARNYLTEHILGLRWQGFGRYPTGISREERDAAAAEIGARLGVDLAAFRFFLRMYTIKVRALPAAVFAELGRLGDPDREFLKPRIVDIRRIAGAANARGSVIRYRVTPRFLSFRLRLEVSDPDRCLLYRVMEGFAKDGVLLFEIRPRPGGSSLSVLVGFDIRTGAAPIRWSLFRRFFPTFVHDVIWNHSLCKLKDLAERRALASKPRSR